MSSSASYASTASGRAPADVRPNGIAAESDPISGSPNRAMTIALRHAEDRGRADHGWLDTRHSFSFADYFDAAHMGFGPLRVINEDRLRPGAGFGEHGHRDMEILSYVIEGALEHKDSMGNGSVILPDDVQVMSAGTGIRHSEFNASRSEPVHFLQIWITPDRKGHAPRYEQRRIGAAEKLDRLRLIASGDGRDGSVLIHRDVDLFASILSKGAVIRRAVAPDRRLWLQVVHGDIRVGDAILRAGDGAGIDDAVDLVVTSGADSSEFLLFDLPRV